MIRLPPPGPLAFATATLLPLGLLSAGLAGAVPAWIGLAYMAALVPALDLLVSADPGQEGVEFPGSDALLVALALGHLGLLAMTVAAVGGGGGLSPGARLVLALGAGLWIGQVAVPAAHELIHRTDRRLFWLGATVFASVLFGHHASAHRLVHHVHAATAADPNTARAGEGFYRFFLRAWAGSFAAGWAVERARRSGKGPHPYLAYAALSAGSLMLAFGLAGGPGVLVWVAISLHAQVQLLLADYVQHYGLSRPPRPDGRAAPVTSAHAWNAPHWFSGAAMLNAGRHSDHHLRPARPYPALGAADCPRLPAPLPLSCTLALIPPLWRRVMRPRLARLGAGS